METKHLTALAQLDKNIALNINGFSVFGDKADLCRKIFFAICFEYQNCFDGLHEIDIKKIVSIMGKPESYRSQLNRKCPEPFQKAYTENYTRKYKEGDVVWDTVFEDALYRLNTLAFSLEYGGVFFKDGKMTKVGARESYILVPRIKQHKVKTGKTWKKQYFVEINSSIRDNLIKYFLLFDYNIFQKLETSQKLYAYLCYLRHIQDGKNSVGATNFKLLCELSDANNKTARDNMQKIKKCISEIQKADPEFFLEEPQRVKSSPGDRYKYAFNFKFRTSLLSQEQRKALYLKNAGRYIDDVLFRLFMDKHPEYDISKVSKKDKFDEWRAWLRDHKKDIQEKIDTFYRALKIAFNHNRFPTPQEWDNFVKKNQVPMPDSWSELPTHSKADGQGFAGHRLT